jgi:hypothetical protein
LLEGASDIEILGHCCAVFHRGSAPGLQQELLSLKTEVLFCNSLCDHNLQLELTLHLRLCLPASTKSQFEEMDEDSLPFDVKSRVFRRLSPEDLRTCKAVCREWRLAAREIPTALFINHSSIVDHNLVRYVNEHPRLVEIGAHGVVVSKWLRCGISATGQLLAADAFSEVLRSKSWEAINLEGLLVDLKSNLKSLVFDFGSALMHLERLGKLTLPRIGSQYHDILHRAPHLEVLEIDSSKPLYIPCPNLRILRLPKGYFANHHNVLWCPKLVSLTLGPPKDGVPSPADFFVDVPSLLRLDMQLKEVMIDNVLESIVVELTHIENIRLRFPHCEYNKAISTAARHVPRLLSCCKRLMLFVLHNDGCQREVLIHRVIRF